MENFQTTSSIADLDLISLLSDSGINLTPEDVRNAFVALKNGLPIGYTGSTGIQGIVGPIGFTGSKGTTGETGFVGSRGNTGYNGSQGVIGYTGSVGAKGNTGDGFTIHTIFNSVAELLAGNIPEDKFGFVAGTLPSTHTDYGRLYLRKNNAWTYITDMSVEGASGITGPLGYTGSRGITGYSGSQGVTGYNGSVGYTGSQGERGFVGFNGSRGEFGYSGSKGEQGIPGVGTGGQGVSAEQAVDFGVFTGIKNKLITAGITNEQFTDRLAGLNADAGVTISSAMYEKILGVLPVIPGTHAYNWYPSATTTGKRFIPNIGTLPTASLDSYSGSGLTMTGLQSIKLSPVSYASDFTIAFNNTIKLLVDNTIINNDDNTNYIKILNSNTLEFKIGGTINTITTNTLLELDKNYSFIITRTAGLVTVYINNIKMLTTFTNAEIFNLTQIPLLHKGIIKDIFTFSRAFSLAEVKTSFQYPESTFVDALEDSTCDNQIPLDKFVYETIYDIEKYLVDNTNVLGPNLILDPTFANTDLVSSPWRKSAGVVLENNKVKFLNLPKYNNIYQHIKVAGPCVITLDVTVVSGSLTCHRYKGLAITSTNSGINKSGIYNFYGCDIERVSVEIEGVYDLNNDIIVNSLSVKSLLGNANVLNYSLYEKNEILHMDDMVLVAGVTKTEGENDTTFITNGTSATIGNFYYPFKKDVLYQFELTSTMKNTLFNNFQFSGIYNGLDRLSSFGGKLIEHLRPIADHSYLNLRTYSLLDTRKFSDITISEVKGYQIINFVGNANVVKTSEYGLQINNLALNRDLTINSVSTSFAGNSIGYSKTNWKPDTSKDFVLTLVQNINSESTDELSGIYKNESFNRFFVGSLANTNKVYVRAGATAYTSADTKEGADVYIRLKYKASTKVMTILIDNLPGVDINASGMALIDNDFILGDTGLNLHNVISNIRYFGVYDYFTTTQEDERHRTQIYKMLLSAPIKALQDQSGNYLLDAYSNYIILS